MQSDWTERLMISQKRVRRRAKLLTTSSELERTLRVEGEKWRDLKVILDKEERDVEKLEGLSFKALFHNILGDKNEKLREEKAEYLAAKLKYDTSAELAEGLRAELDRIQADVDALGEVDAEHTELLAEREEFLKQTPGPKGQALIAISENLADHESQRIELREALYAGNEVRKALDLVSGDLDSASSWGVVDMFGGGLMTTLIKHDRMDSASNHAREAQACIQRFQAELVDVSEHIDISIQMDNFTRFGDFFFDGLIMDWFVQSKIGRAQDACKDALDSLKEAVLVCETRLRLSDSETEKLGKERHALLEG